MGDAIKSIFGGSDDSATKAQKKANERTQAFIEKQAKQAREDVMKYFPQAQHNRALGVQAALDMYQKFIPQQSNAFQVGNTRAQTQLQRGQTDFSNAILGLPERAQSTQFLAPQMIKPDMSFLQSNAPLGLGGPAPAAAPAAAPVAPVNPASGLGGTVPKAPLPTQPTYFAPPPLTKPATTTTRPTSRPTSGGVRDTRRIQKY